jgi:hypothetical protein
MNPSPDDRSEPDNPLLPPVGLPLAVDEDFVDAALAMPNHAAGWNFKALACALVITFILQNIFLPCFCAMGSARMALAFIFDGLVIVRVLIARGMREQGRGWIFYLILIYTSPLWIKGLVWAFTGEF